MNTMSLHLLLVALISESLSFNCVLEKDSLRLSKSIIDSPISKGCQDVNENTIIMNKNGCSIRLVSESKTYQIAVSNRISRVYLSNLNVTSFSISCPRHIRYTRIKLLDLSHNNLQTLDRDMCYYLPKLRYLDLSHNSLESLDLSPCDKLRYLGLSHNMFGVIDIGPGHFSKLIKIDLSNNIISKYFINRQMRLMSDLKELVLNNNSISGVLKRQDLNVFYKNVTVDLSFNNISRFDMRKQPTDHVISRHIHLSRSYTTLYKINDNLLKCDCYTGLLMNAKDSSVQFTNVSCDVVDIGTPNVMTCPLPGREIIKE